TCWRLSTFATTIMGLFECFSQEQKESLGKGLEKPKESIFGRLERPVTDKSTVDDEEIDELEEIHIATDVAAETTVEIIDRIEKRVAKDKYTSTDELNDILQEEVAALLMENKSGSVTHSFETDHLPKPYVMMVVGVNGVGKTTTIGKLAHQFKSRGKKV